MSTASFLPELQTQPTDVGDGSQKSKDYERITKKWLSAAYEEARADITSNEDIKRQAQYIDYILGKQWPSSRPTYRAAPVDNRVWRLIWELVSLLTDIRPTFQIKSSASPEYDGQANIVNKTVRSWWMNADADMMLAFTIIYGILCTGYGKLSWNPDMRNGMGDFELLPMGPLECLPLKPRHTLQSAQGVIQDSIRPLGWIRKKFPLRGSLVKADADLSRYSMAPQAPAHLPAQLFEILSPQMQRIVGGAPQQLATAFPMARYREFWMQDWSINTSNVTVTVGPPGTNWSYKVRSKELLYPRGRLFIMAGDVLLDDGPNPYWHGMYPYEAIRLNAVPWQWLGVSELRPLIPLQDIINSTLAGIIDAVRKAVNPIFYAPQNAVSESVLNSIDWSMPGAKLRYSNAATRPPEFGQPPQLPPFLMQVIQLAAREMDQSSGVAAVDEAVRKNQVPSGDTLDQIREAKQTPIRLKGRNIEIFLRSLGQMSIFNTFQFYGIKRRMFMMGGAGLTEADFDWDPGTVIPKGQDPQDFAKRFSFLVEQGSLLNVNRVERAITLQRLRQTKDIDRRTLISNLDLGINLDDVEQNLKVEAFEQAGILGLQQRIVAASQAAAQAGNGGLAQFLTDLANVNAPPITITAEKPQQAAL